MASRAGCGTAKDSTAFLQSLSAGKGFLCEAILPRHLAINNYIWLGRGLWRVEKIRRRGFRRIFTKGRSTPCHVILGSKRSLPPIYLSTFVLHQSHEVILSFHNGIICRWSPASQWSMGTAESSYLRSSRRHRSAIQRRQQARNLKPSHCPEFGLIARQAARLQGPRALL